MTRNIAVPLGPRVPLVPVSDFARLRLTHEQMDDLWSIIGPTVERNMARNVPLWNIFAICYAQGLENAAALVEEQGDA